MTRHLHAALIAGDDTGAVLGMPFYVMQAIDGWSPMDGGWQAPFDTDLEARRGLAFQLVEGAAKLGRVDWLAQGLEGFGRPDGFHERQVDRWLTFLDAYKVRELPGLEVPLLAAQLLEGRKERRGGAPGEDG